MELIRINIKEMSSCTTIDNGTSLGKLNQMLQIPGTDIQHRSAGYLGIKVSAKAEDQMAQKVLQKNTVKGIRISIATKGCSGLSYKMDYAEDGINITPKDEVIELQKVKLFIDPKSSLFLFGMSIEYEDNGIEAGFKFNNPNSKGSCGCGESFFV